MSSYAVFKLYLQPVATLAGSIAVSNLIQHNDSLFLRRNDEHTPCAFLHTPHNDVGCTVTAYGILFYRCLCVYFIAQCHVLHLPYRMPNDRL